MQAQQLSAALAFLKAIDNFHLDAIPEMLDDGLLYELRPGSAGGLGFPDGLSKSQYLEFLKGLPGFVKKFNFQPPKLVVQEVDKLAMHMFADGIAADGSPYKNEYAVFVTFAPGSTKFLYVMEMFDSSYVLQKIKDLRHTP